MQGIKMNIIFVAGTDTGIGKTLVTGLLAEYLSSIGKRVVPQKWIQTGMKAEGAGDLSVHLKLMNKSEQDFKDDLLLMAPYSFKATASPHLAAQLEDRKIDPAKIKKSLKELSLRFDYVIIEGTGGLLVPFDKGRLIIDIVKDLGIHVLLVIHNRLGAINHALLSIEALKARRIPIIGMVFNNLSKEDRIVFKDNQRIIEEISHTAVLGELPMSDNIQVLKDRFKAIGDKIDLSRLD